MGTWSSSEMAMRVLPMERRWMNCWAVWGEYIFSAELVRSGEC